MGSSRNVPVVYLEAASLEEREIIRQYFLQTFLQYVVLKGRPCRSGQELVQVIFCTLGTVLFLFCFSLCSPSLAQFSSIDKLHQVAFLYILTM